MNEPCQEIRTVLQTHDLHALSSLRLLLTDYTLDDINEDEQVIELYKVWELVGQLSEHTRILVHKVTNRHWRVSHIL